MNQSSYQLAINIFEFPDYICCFDACLECKVTVLSKLNSKITCLHKSVHHLDSSPRPPECKSIALPIEPYGCGFWWNVARVFSTSSSLSDSRTQADHRIDSRWQTWRRKMIGFWCWAVEMAMSTVPGELTAWQTDGQTGFQLYIYR